MSKCSKCKEKSPLLYKRHGMVFCPTCLEKIKQEKEASKKPVG